MCTFKDVITSATSLKVAFKDGAYFNNVLECLDVAEVSTVLECVLLKAVLTSAPSLKVGIQRRCLPQQRLRMPTFKDVAKISTVFESCSLSKTVFWDPSLYPLFDRRRIAFF